MRFPHHLLFLFAVLCCLSSGCAARLPSAAWVVRYDCDTPAEVEQLCAAARAAGFDTLLLQVRGRADAYYRSVIAPRGETVADGFDPLAASLAACAPTPLHAWLNVYYLWNAEPRPTEPRHPAHPSHDWIIADADGRKVSDYTELERAVGWIEGLYADPASEAYRQLMMLVVAELLARYPVQGIHLDFVRYPGAAYGQTGVLGKRFQAERGIDPRLLPTELTRATIDRWLKGAMRPGESVLTTAALFWADLRAEEVTAMVRAIRTAIKESDRPETTLSAAVFPDIDDAYLARGQDWQRWAQEGLVDSLLPMAYFGPAARVDGQLREIALHRAPGVTYWAGLGAYRKSPEQIASEAATAEELGYDGIALFSLGHLLRKPEGVAPYVTALAGYGGKPVQLTFTASTPPAAASKELTALRRIVTTASGGSLPMAAKKVDRILQAKLSELAAAQDHAFTATLEQLRSRPVLPPPWVELHGIFRYVHPLDPPETRQSQQNEMTHLRSRLLDGEEFAALAREFSQGGSRRLGGALGRRFLDLAEATDAALDQLAPGSPSPVLAAENGFWLHRLEARGQDAPAEWHTLPWPARRLLFRQKLNTLLP